MSTPLRAACRPGRRTGVRCAPRRGLRTGRRTRPPAGRAFTLLEVLLVIGLVAVLAGGVFGFIFDLVDTRERLAVESARARDASRLFDLVEHAVMTTAVDHGWGPGVSGSAEQIALAGMTLTLDDDGVAPLRVVRLRFDEQGGVIVADVTVERAGSGRGERLDLVTGLEKVRFRYLHGRTWTDRFDSAGHGHLPSAVEVALWFDRGAPGPEEELGLDGVDPLGLGSGFDEEALASIAEERGRFEEDELEPLRAPDRFRVIAVPDAESIGHASGDAAGGDGIDGGFDDFGGSGAAGDGGVFP